MDRSLCAAGCAFLAMLWLAGCQSAPEFRSVLDNAPIKPGDVLLVNSSASAEPFAERWVVDASGNVRLPYSGPWRVAGKTPSEFGKELSSYFSIRRSVTFKIEKIDSEPPNPPTTNKVSLAPAKTTVLKSPKLNNVTGGF
jgi:hypothetical protein